MLKRSVAALSLALLTGCTTLAADPLDRLQQQAWAAPWAMCSGDWEAKPSCSCRNRSQWIANEVERRGLGTAELRVGYRGDHPDDFHMIAVVTTNGVQRVVDYDGLHLSSDYPWIDHPDYDWRAAAKHHTGKAY